MSFLIALIIGILGAVPLAFTDKPARAVMTGIVGTFVAWWFVWAVLPSTVWPLWGGIGFMVVAMWFVCWFVEYMFSDYKSSPIPATFAIVGFLIFFLSACGGSAMFRSAEYAGMIGEVEERVWTEDVQPKDPKHVRLVPREMATWLADKQIGDVSGQVSLGSQFHVGNEFMTLQLINGEFWYVAPLEFNGFFVWKSVQASPGYVKVLAEDPRQSVEVVTGESFKYMTGAYFSHDLERHLWSNGYRDKGLTDFNFEIDEEGSPWWVVTVFEPTITWGGEKVLGVVIVNPTSGEMQFFSAEEVPHWVDRVVPSNFIATYIDDWGEYSHGWWNSTMFGAKSDLFEGEDPTINYGSDGEPYWVTTLTSTSQNDESMIGLVYTNSRTGKSVRYKASGGTEASVLNAVNNKVSYKNWHGSGAMLYNVYGTMASIVPLLGESHTFQGVAIVDIENMVVAVGDDQYTAYREYQKLLSTSDQQVATEFAHDFLEFVGPVLRIAPEVKAGETFYYITVEGVRHIFTGVSELSPKLPITQMGDTVKVKFLGSGEDVLPMMAFDNVSISVEETANQIAIRARTATRMSEAVAERELKSARGEVQNMSDEELQKLLEYRRKNP